MRVTTACGAVVAAAFILAAPDMGAWAQPAAVPADFNIQVVSSSLGPARNPPDYQSVEINASGDAKLSAVARGDTRLPAITVKLPPGAVAGIYQALSDQRFFELQQEYKDPGVSGGDQAQIIATANGKTHAVKTVNMRVKAFDAVTRAVNAALPANRAIQYNALRVQSYKEVER